MCVCGREALTQETRVHEGRGEGGRQKKGFMRNYLWELSVGIICGNYLWELSGGIICGNYLWELSGGQRVPTAQLHRRALDGVRGVAAQQGSDTHTNKGFKLKATVGLLLQQNQKSF